MLFGYSDAHSLAAAMFTTAMSLTLPRLVTPTRPCPTIAFSPTIQFPFIPDASESEVEHWHAEYVTALRALHADHKGAGRHAGHFTDFARAKN